MTDRWLLLYARSRRVPLALATSIGAIALIWTLWVAFTDRRPINFGLTVLTAVLALAPFIPTMSSDDDSLESTAALPWPPRRILHLTGCFAMVTGALLAANGTGVSFGPSWILIRDCAGLAGLIGLCVPLMNTRLAWAPLIGWAAPQVILGSEATDWRQGMFWLVQPAGNKVAATIAVGLFLVGLLAYAWRPGRPVPPAEVTLGQ